MSLREIVERRISNLEELRERTLLHGELDYALEVLRSVLREEDEERIMRGSRASEGEGAQRTEIEDALLTMWEMVDRMDEGE